MACNPYQMAEYLQHGVSSSDILLQEADSFGKPEVTGQTTKDRDTAVVRNLPSSSTRDTFGASPSDTQPQGAGSSSKRVEEGDLQHAACQAGFT